MFYVAEQQSLLKLFFIFAKVTPLCIRFTSVFSCDNNDYDDDNDDW